MRSKRKEGEGRDTGHAELKAEAMGGRWKNAKLKVEWLSVAEGKRESRSEKRAEGNS